MQLLQNQKSVWPYHVLLRRNKFNTALTEFWPLMMVQAFALAICGAKVLWRTLAYHATKIALEAPAARSFSPVLILASNKLAYTYLRFC